MSKELVSRDILDDILELYEKYHPRLATNVYAFGVELRDLIDNVPTVETDIEKERPIVYTITRTDAVHYSIYTKDNRADIQANASIDSLFHMLVSISEELNKQGYAVLFEVD